MSGMPGAVGIGLGSELLRLVEAQSPQVLLPHSVTFVWLCRVSGRSRWPRWELGTDSHVPGCMLVTAWRRCEPLRTFRTRKKPGRWTTV